MISAQFFGGPLDGKFKEFQYELPNEYIVKQLVSIPDFTNPDELVETRDLVYLLVKSGYITSLDSVLSVGTAYFYQGPR